MPFTCFSSPDSRRLENFPLACLNALVELSDALLSLIARPSPELLAALLQTRQPFEAVIGCCGHPLSIEIEAKASPFIRLKPTTALVTPYLGQGDTTAGGGHQTRDATTHAYYYKYCYVRTVWKFHDFSITQILREINFGESRSSKVPFLLFVGL